MRIRTYYIHLYSLFSSFFLKSLTRTALRGIIYMYLCALFTRAREKAFDEGERGMGYMPFSMLNGKDDTSNEYILIVDDDEFNRAILDNLFSRFYQTEEAENGRIGLDKIKECPEKYSAILLDAMMPEMDGLEVLENLKKEGLNDKIPVFLITAEASDSVMREAYRLGVMDVISKPVVPYVVERRVNSVVELFRARKQLSTRVDVQASELLQKEHRISSLNRGLFEALAAAIEFRNGESGEHVRRIHDITRFLLTRTDLGEGMSEEEISNIALASVMHDVGKIAIPDEILNKPARHTPAYHTGRAAA